MCFQMQRDSGLWYSVEYASFSVSSEADFYRLSVSGFSGDEGDAIAAPVKSLRRVNGRRFSTPDVDNDMNIYRCDDGITGWWFKNCARSTLNHDTNAYWNAVTDVYIYNVISTRMLVKLD